MFGDRCRLALVACVAALVVGVLVQGHQVRFDLGGGRGAGDRASAAAVVDSVPVGVATSAVRVRGWSDNDISSLSPSSKSRLGALLLALVSGLLPVAAAGWWLARRERRSASPLRRSSLAPLRAPPVPALA